MLNPFPIQFLALLAYFVLRVFVGGVFLYFSYTHFKSNDELTQSLKKLVLLPFGTFSAWLFTATEAIAGVMFIVGFYTQIAALAAMFLSVLFILFHKRFTSVHIESRLFYLLLFAAALSLFITGAGAFAFDLPI